MNLGGRIPGSTLVAVIVTGAAGADRKLTRQEFIDRMQLFCVGNQIATHQSEPVFKAQFIFSLVVVAEIAPISA